MVIDLEISRRWSETENIQQIVVHIDRVVNLRHGGIPISQPRGSVRYVWVFESQILAVGEVYLGDRNGAGICIVTLRVVSLIMPCVFGRDRIPGVRDDCASAFGRVI